MVEDVLDVVDGAFIIQYVKACAGHGQPPPMHLRRELDRFLVRFERGLQAIEFSELASEAQIDQRIAGCRSAAMRRKFLNRFVPRVLTEPTDSTWPIGHPARWGCSAKHGVIGLKRFRRGARCRQDVAAQFVQREGVRDALRCLDPALQCGRDGAAFPIRFRPLDDLRIWRALKLTGDDCR